MDEITQLAERLGKAIAASAEATKLREARKALDAASDVSKTLDDYREQSEKVARLDTENKPVEVEDKHKLRDLHEKLVSSEVFKLFTAAQVDYVDMMRKVNGALQSQLADTEKD